MPWHLVREHAHRAVRTLVLLAWLAAGAQGYGITSLLGLTLTVGSWQWTRRSWRNRSWVYRTATRAPAWARRLLSGEHY
jgi:hypothetical protein